MTRRSRSDWQRLFEEHNSSGLTAAEFCRQRSLCPKYFGLRKRQLGWPSPSAFVRAGRTRVESETDAPRQPDEMVTVRVATVTVPLTHLASALTEIVR